MDPNSANSSRNESSQAANAPSQPRIPGPSNDRPKATLTNRELQILSLIAADLSNKEIAQRLHLGRRTVETHVDHVLRKLDVPTRSRAVSEALEAGLLASDLGVRSSNQENTPNNLPTLFTPLIGREQDLADVQKAMRDNRLVTLCGLGGVGKTRLALDLAANALPEFNDGVWFCDLTAISSPTLVPNVVARALSIAQSASRPLIETITRTLRRRHILLILDNCEHVLDASADAVDELLRQCPRANVLATSRQSLNIIGEVVYRIAPLEVPDKTTATDVHSASKYSSIRLFVSRGQAANSRFSLRSDNVGAVVDVCRQLDGIPLAIELAASRVKAASVHSLARTLSDHFQDLGAAPHVAVPRHKTLGALIDWSYGLLEDEERQLFRRAGVFAGGFGTDAAIAVCCSTGLEAERIPKILWAMVDKSLLLADVSGETERYRMLESTRAYALERLTEIGERDTTLLRHAEYFSGRATAADASWDFGSVAARIDGLDLELDNHRAALAWTLKDRRNAVIGAKIAAGLMYLWTEGLAREGQYWLELALSLVDEASHPALAASLWLARALLVKGPLKIDYGHRSASFYRVAGDVHGEIVALNAVAFGLLQSGRREEANDQIAAALSLARKFADKGALARCLQTSIALRVGRPSRALFKEALQTFRDLENEDGAGNLLLNFAEAEFADGKVDHAIDLVTEAINVAKRTKRGRFPMALVNLGAYLIASGELDRAYAVLKESLPFSRDREDSATVVATLQHLALIHARRQDTRKAALLLCYIDARFKELGMERQSTERWSYEGLLSSIRHDLSATEIERLGSVTAGWSEERAIDEALGSKN